MATAVLSDIHLGTRAGNDLLRQPAVRERLFAELEGIDRIVLLGDAVELRDGPLGPALAAARPFFEELGEALGGPRVVIVPGNHDHQLAAGALDSRRAEAGAGPLPLDWSARPGSGPPAELARSLRASASGAGAELTLSYPGVWLRPDVFATHGHYLDWHNTVPSIESLATSASARLQGARREPGISPDEYERAVAPVYALAYQLAQTRGNPRHTAVGRASMGVWRTLNGNASGGLRAKLLGGLAIPGAVALLNRAGLGPFGAEISSAELRRAALRAMGEMLSCLGVEAEHVIFGHSHRAGPLPGDDEAEWITPDGTRLVNCGSWMYEPAFLGKSPEDSPHWPGGLVLLDEDGGNAPPELHRLLTDLTHDELRAYLPA